MVATTVLAVPLPRLVVSVAILDEVGQLPAEVSRVVAYGKSPLHGPLTASPPTTCQVPVQVTVVGRSANATACVRPVRCASL